MSVSLRTRRSAPLPLLMAAGTGAAVASVPLVYLVLHALGLGPSEMLSALAEQGLLRLLRNSLGLAAAVTTTCLVVGVPSAWLVVRADLPARRLWPVLAALPLAMPSYIAAFGWLASQPGVNGFVPAWLILSAVSVPYVTLPVAAAIRAADPALEEVARSLGRGPLGAVRFALLPQIAPAAAAGSLLVVLYVLSDFGAVALLRFPVFTFAIERQYGSFFGRDTAVALALVLVLLAATVVGLERRVRGVGQRWSVSRSARRTSPRVPLGRWRWPALALLCLAPAGAFVLPLLALFRRLAVGTARPLDWSELGSALVATCVLAGGGALIAIALALPIGSLAARYRGRVVAAIETVSFAGHALPGIVVGLSLVVLAINLAPGLYQTAALVMFAYAVLFLPKAIGSVRSSVAQVPPILDDVARSLGTPRWRAHATISLRLASPGVAAGALLVALTAMKELPATLILRPTGVDTLATEIWSRTAGGAYGAAAPYALALVLVASLPAFWLSRPTSWEMER